MHQPGDAFKVMSISRKAIESSMRKAIRAELAMIEPHDSLEQEHLAEALAWVDSGAELCRISKPATPPKHLVSYFAVVDADHILLVDHRNAQLWLPTGGHVEPGEHPRDTVVRELQEELGLVPVRPIGAPLMVTCTDTVGLTAGHRDVSLWYVVEVSRKQPLNFGEQEFNAVQWFRFNEVPFEHSDPQMRRFVEKLGSLTFLSGERVRRMPLDSVETSIVCETPRLILRRFNESDVDPLLSFLGDPEVMRFSVTGPETREGIQTKYLRSCLKRYSQDGLGQWAVVRRSDGICVGECGICVQEVDGEREFEISYRIRRDCWGIGLATEAAQACRDYGFNKAGLRRLISIIESENAASIRVAEKMGMTLEKRASFHKIPVLIYSVASAVTGTT